MRITALRLFVALVLAGAVPHASAQQGGTRGARPAPEQSVVRDLTPAGAGIPDALAADLLRRVQADREETNRFVRIRRVPAATGDRRGAWWQKQWYANREVVVEVQSTKDGFAPYVALVGGRTYADVARDLPSREAAEVRSRIRREDPISGGEFRLACAWLDDRWVLRGAFLQPESRATLRTGQALPPPEFRVLWTGAPDTREVDPCMVAALWRDL